jgi:hypothetical protein
LAEAPEERFFQHGKPFRRRGGRAKPFAERGGGWSPESLEIDVRVGEFASRDAEERDRAAGRTCTPMIEACWSGSITKKPR